MANPQHLGVWFWRSSLVQNEHYNTLFSGISVRTCSPTHILHQGIIKPFSKCCEGNRVISCKNTLVNIVFLGGRFHYYSDSSYTNLLILYYVPSKGPKFDIV